MQDVRTKKASADMQAVGRTADSNAKGGGYADPNGRKADKTRILLGRCIEVALTCLFCVETKRKNPVFGVTNKSTVFAVQ